LGSRPIQRACKVASQKRKFGVKESVREWTLTFPREFPPYELESRWTLECLKSDCRGQNSMDWRIFYTNEKILKLICRKWVHITHLDIWNTSYGQKKGRESKSNWQFDSQPLKVDNQLDFLMCKWRATYRWKALNENYNFSLDLNFIEGLHTKLWGSKVARVPTLGISKLHLGVLGQKCHLDVGLVKKHKVYYKGKGGDFPQVQAMVSIVNPSSPWFACGSF